MKRRKAKVVEQPMRIPKSPIALWEKLPLEERIKEVSAPLYLKRYE